MKGIVQLSWLSVLAGIWLIIAPFVIGYSDRGATTNDIILGVIVIIVSLIALSGDRMAAGRDSKNRDE